MAKGISKSQYLDTELLRFDLARKKWTQQRLANRLDVHIRTVAKMLDGKLRRHRWSMFVALGELFGRTPSEYILNLDQKVTLLSGQVSRILGEYFASNEDFARVTGLDIDLLDEMSSCQFIEVNYRTVTKIVAAFQTANINVSHLDVVVPHSWLTSLGRQFIDEVSFAQDPEYFFVIDILLPRPIAA